MPAISKPKYLIISGILTKEQPNKLEYTHGDRLDLRGLVVTIFFDYGDKPVDVAFENFAEWGITTNPEHRETLSRLAHHGANVVISVWSEGLDLESEDDDEEMQAVTTFLTIERKDPVVEWPQSYELSFFQTLSHISPFYIYANVPGSFTWDRPDIPLGEWGVKSHNLTFTPNDTTNYNILMNDVEIESHFIEMVKINPGTFRMGSPESEEGRGTYYYNDMSEESWDWDYGEYEPKWLPDEDLHTVTLTKGFYMGKYEVTQEQYTKVMGTNPSVFKEGLGLPVTNVSWIDAIAFCNRLSLIEGLDPVYSVNGMSNPDDWFNDWYDIDEYDVYNFSLSLTANGYRLPTEAQWEYACRAGTTTAYNTGNIIHNNTGWYAENTSSTQEAGLKPPNAWGLYDMHGNVFEWCIDRYYGRYYLEGQVDPLCNDISIINEPLIRVYRGGAFNSDSALLRSAARSKENNFNRRLANVGFRVIRY